VAAVAGYGGAGFGYCRDYGEQEEGDGVKVRCAHCKQWADLHPSHVNRAKRDGNKLYCGRKCAGLGRRKPKKPKKQRVAEKRLYDQEYRRKNRAMLKAKKHAHFKATYDPVKAAKERKKRMHLHVEYCRQPEYKAWKREYDRKLRASEYGDFDEAYMLLLDLDREIKQRMTDYEIRKANGTLNKRLQRQRAWQSLVSGQP
jgi:hypothetical protein